MSPTIKFDTKTLDHGVSSSDDYLPGLTPASVSSGASDSSYMSHYDSCEAAATSSSELPKEIPVFYEDDAASSSSSSSNRKVTFGDVEIRTYPVILGDHPDCVGPAIAFDWDYVRQDRIDLEQYEAERPPRRHDEQLILDWFLRKRLLKCYAGVTEEEIQENAKEMARIRKQREQTRKSIQFKSNVRHLLAKATLGLVSDKSLRPKDRGVHVNRWKMNADHREPANEQRVAAAC